jgi:phosphoadenosine phosphosulfate reductase
MSHRVKVAAKVERQLDLPAVNQRLKDASALDTLRWAVGEFGEKIALASSFGAEDVVLIDLLARATARPRIFTLDTGRLPQETYDVWDKIGEKYNLHIGVFAAEQRAIEDFVAAEGPNAFYKSVALRKECCRVRKILPLRKALAQLDAWICGLRREQSVTRAAVEKVEVDAANGNIYKINPLADWTEKQVWDYIKENDVPYNALHDRGYPSIGCAPCTRAIKPGEDVRAGRWWWESPETKECGLHAHDKSDGGEKATLTLSLLARALFELGPIPLVHEAELARKAVVAPERKGVEPGQGLSLLRRLFRGIGWFLEATYI